MTANLWRDLSAMDSPGHSLSQLTTYRIGGAADHFLTPRTTQDVAELLRLFHEEGLSWRILGGGANVLLDDRAHETPFIHIGHLDEISHRSDSLRVGGGVLFPGLVNRATGDGWAGLETLAGIPGQMGGICAMNAGGRHGEIAELVESIDFVTSAGEVRSLRADEIGFRYRGTELPAGIITSVTLRLEDGDPEDLRRRRAGILQAKRDSQPLTTPSGGCVFANPDSIAAGQLVEELGLKGQSLGDARISPVHGNFIVNEGRARFDDVLGLIELIETRARNERGVSLVREIKIWPGA